MYLCTETDVLEYNALDSGLPKLGMMISQTRVSDTGPDVNYESDSLREPEFLLWVIHLYLIGMEPSTLALLRCVAGPCLSLIVLFSSLE